MLSHANLDVYECAIEFLAVAFPVVEEVPEGFGDLRNQFRRSIVSIPLNIAEGAGKISGADKRRFFAIARGSAHESSAILDVLERLGALDQDTHRQAEELLTRVVSMLTKMCQSDGRLSTP